MNQPPFIPQDKFDFAACERLRVASNEEIEPYLLLLLEWVQDINWPVAPKVVARLQQCGVELAPVVVEVLQGNDDVWKYWLVDALLSGVNVELFAQCREVIERIANNPSEGEVTEEVDQVAREVLGLYSERDKENAMDDELRP